MEKSKKTITADMAIGDVVDKWPETITVFAKHGMHCVGCTIASFETIEQGAKAHEMDLDKLLDDLNKAVNKKEE